MSVSTVVPVISKRKAPKCAKPDSFTNGKYAQTLNLRYHYAFRGSQKRPNLDVYDRRMR